MKITFRSVSTTFSILLATFIMGMCSSSHAQTNWRTFQACENNNVRFELRSAGPYKMEYQLVINSAVEGFQKLIREGAINEGSINNKGEFIIRDIVVIHGLWAFRGFAPRDNGLLIYKIAPGTGVLTLDVAWTSGDILASHIPDFTGAEFYGCNYN